MAQVIVDEAGDEVVAMVVAWLQAQLQGMPNGGTGLPQPLGLQLLDEKAVGFALIDQQRQTFLGTGDQLAGVPDSPCRAIGTEIARKRLLPQGLAMAWQIGASADSER